MLVPNPFSSSLVKEKIKKTNLKKYNVEYPQQSEDIKKASNETNLSKYGVLKYSQTYECKLQVIKTQIEKYGTLYSKTEEYKKRIRNTNLSKYGVEHFSKTVEYKKHIKDLREINTKIKYENKLDNNEYEILYYTDSNFIIKHFLCGKEFLIDKNLFYARDNINVCICTNCNPKGLQSSFIELDLCNFLNDINVSYISKDKSILNGKELDIYIPNNNLAIEVNGVYWHSEFYKEQNYHVNKTLACQEKGIQLLHIWEDDWKHKRDIIKSIILNKLGFIKNKIFARKCIIKDVSSKEAKLFLNENHIQGFSPSQIKIGLYFNNEIVSLMTFGWRYTNGKKEYELIRFCNKINTNIIGGASKLFNYFLNNIDNIKEIISYADISLFSGELYEKLGFTKISLSKPNYFWVVDGLRKHRFNYNKQRLIKEGFDPNKTEVKIMHERGYYRVFSCGQEKWIYNKK